MPKEAGPPVALLNLAVLDDHALFRAGFVAAVAQWAQGRVVLQAQHGLDYERQCAEVGHIHIALVDLCMPKRDGFETIQWIVRNQPRTLPMAITFDPTPQAIKKALRAGARAVLSKSVLPPALFKALDHVRLAGFHYNELVSRELHRALEAEDEQRSPDARWASLTNRERAFVLLYTSPAVPTLAVVAQRWGVAPSTVETHRSNVVTKLGIHSRAELVRMVLENGWG